MPVVGAVGLPRFAVAVVGNIGSAADITVMIDGAVVHMSTVQLAMFSINPHVAGSTVGESRFCRGAGGIDRGIIAVGQHNRIHVNINQCFIFITGTLLDGCALYNRCVEFQNTGLLGTDNTCVVGAGKDAAVDFQGTVDIQLGIRHIVGGSDAGGRALSGDVGDGLQFDIEAIASPVGIIHQINLTVRRKVQRGLFTNVKNTARLQQQVLIYCCSAGVEVDCQILLQGQNKILRVIVISN